ncbi:unnamed protein product [Musa banksii]
MTGIRAPILTPATLPAPASRTRIPVSMSTPKFCRLPQMRLLSRWRRAIFSKKRPCNNREAVRKYREKKKAHAASLEEEAAHLRAINQQLLKRLQNQAALEAEIARLKCLLVDLRGRIEGEIGSFPYHKPAKGSGDFVSNVTQGNMLAGAQVLNPCSFHCDDQVNWFYPGMHGNDVGETGVFDDQGLGVSEIGNMQCMGSSTSGSQDFASCKSKTAKPVDCSSNATRLEGARAPEDS